MADCIFCQIVEKKIPCQTLYEDETVLAFRDLYPQAPTHVLIIPKKHFSHLNEVESDSASILGHLLLTAKKLAKNLGISEKGYRCVLNTLSDGGQTVFHLHLHLLGGQPLGPSLAR